MLLGNTDCLLGALLFEDTIYVHRREYGDDYRMMNCLGHRAVCDIFQQGSALIDFLWRPREDNQHRRLCIRIACNSRKDARRLKKKLAPM